jgi:ubiquinone/menaquinone biosynthesis C-methylase UbiE
MAEEGARTEIDAVSYAEAFSAYRSNDVARNELWAKRFAELGNLSKHTSVIDIGCGVGRYAIPLSKICTNRLMAVDRCPAMLDRFRKHAAANGSIRFTQCDATALPYCDGVFDAAVMSMSLHFIDHPAAALKEASRLLNQGGRLLIKTCTREHVETMDAIEFRYFPSRQIDLQRCLPLKELESLLKESGFGVQAVEVFEEVTSKSGAQWLEWFSAKATSTLWLIDSYRYAMGMVDARRELAHVEEVVERVPITVLVGRRK